ncbi:hypothetical protein J4732_20880 [Serratia marcescens]|uniref:Uncharacterized protein n=1 Tax=Serratia marcescens TaxID=615 RepID=A0A939NKT4_SERMA|nr:hypothetical protein [Serratia marcescens]
MFERDGAKLYKAAEGYAVHRTTVDYVRGAESDIQINNPKAFSMPAGAARLWRLSANQHDTKQCRNA